MNNSGTSRKGIQPSVPEPISKRQKCTTCARTRSIGQFPQNSTTCVRCKPMPAGWRRGDLAVGRFNPA